MRHRVAFRMGSWLGRSASTRPELQVPAEQSELPARPRPPRRLYVAASSNPLFIGPWFTSEVRDAIVAAMQARGSGSPIAAYIGACNGDLADYFSICQAAVGRLSLPLPCAHVNASEHGRDACVAAVQRAALVVIGGGDVQLGWDAMQRKGLDLAVAGAAEAGSVLLGISAGAIIMGSHGYSGKDDEFVDPFPTLNLCPHIFGAHEEAEEWRDLRRAVGASPEGAQPRLGIGIPTNAAGILRDGPGGVMTFEPSLKDAVVITTRRGDEAHPGPLVRVLPRDRAQRLSGSLA